MVLSLLDINTSTKKRDAGSWDAMPLLDMLLSLTHLESKFGRTPTETILEV